MKVSLQSIFRSHFDEFASDRKLPLRALKAASAIRDCRTPALGGRVLKCPENHTSEIQYNACRHRTCPKCADAPRQRWLAAEGARVLPCEHYHVVFTLPHALIALWEFNRVLLNQMLLDSARESLLELCADERFMGGTPGLLMALHTWGRTLNRHPHVHCLISAGGLDEQGGWRECRRNYLVPVRALQALFRGKLLHRLRTALSRQRLKLPERLDELQCARSFAALYRKHWNIHLGQRYEHGRGVMLYLARYVKGGPLSAERELSHRDEQVSFGYTDHRDSRPKTMRLHAHHFIDRVLWHAPEPGQHMVRHCGLYASQARVRRDHSRKLLVLETPRSPVPERALACHDPVMSFQPVCVECKRPLVVAQCLLPMHRNREFSLDTTGSGSPRLGPTSRWNGQPTADEISGLRRRSLRRCLPLT